MESKEEKSEENQSGRIEQDNNCMEFADEKVEA